MPFDIKTADLASKLVDVTWEKELLIDGKSIKDRGIYPQKLAFAATSLMVGSKIYKGTEYNDVHHMCLIGIGEILITIEQKLNSFKFGSYDMYLLKNAYNFTLKMKVKMLASLIFKQLLISDTK